MSRLFSTAPTVSAQALPTPQAAPAEEAAAAWPALPALAGERLDEAQLADIAAQAGARARAKSTVRCYTSCWRGFEDFCRRRGRASLPASPETVQLYLGELIADRYKPGSIGVILAALNHHHRDAGHPSPAQDRRVKETFEGYKRLCVGTPLAAQSKDPLMADDITAVCEVLDARGGIKEVRDKALILLGFGGAFRSCEPTYLHIEHFRFDRKGMTLLLPYSKTDQDGRGAHVGIVRAPRAEVCPVLAIRRWFDVLARHGITAGPICRSIRPTAGGGVAFSDTAMIAHTLRVMLKQHCERAGIDASNIAWHSVRRGHVTQAFRNGASLADVQKTGRWAKADTVMLYYDEVEALESSSSRHLWKS